MEAGQGGGENVIILCSICQTRIPLQQALDQTMPLSDAVVTMAPCPVCFEAFEELVKLQCHYAKLLNMHDGGERWSFGSAKEWLDRLRQLKSNAPHARPAGGYPTFGERRALEIVAMLSGRKGFDSWWENIREDTQREILAELAATIDVLPV